MHVAVLGAGVVGVTTAYYLAQAGHRVTLVDARSGVARGASFANGGQLSYSFTESLARPGFLRQLPRVLLGRDPGIHLQPGFDTKFMRWGLAFLRQCSPARARHNSLASLRLALRSAVLLSTLRERVPVEFAHRSAGKLVLLSSKREHTDAVAACQIKRSNGCPAHVLTMNEACQLEPALTRLRRDYVGAVYAKNDEVADARAFAEGLADWLVTHSDTTLALNTGVKKLHVERNTAHGVHTDTGDIDADAVVIALGAWSPAILARAGVHTPIYPVRGYSVTLPPGDDAPEVAVTDLAQRIVFSRLDGQLRIAGFADFVGMRERNDAARIARLVAIARSTAPSAADYSVSQTAPWGGFRPMTPDSMPRVGACKVSGLFLNTGHGPLGWTLACATGHDLAALVSRRAA